MPRLRVWLITTGEPLPCDGPGARLFRTGLLAGEFDCRGHEVTWWTSTFNHGEKIQRYKEERIRALGERSRLILLRSPGYARNVSVARFLDHKLLCRNLKNRMNEEERPDLVVAAYPIPELCLAAIEFGKRHQIPVVVDVRDLWPEVHLSLLPPWARPLGQVLSRPFWRQARKACGEATAIVAPTQGYLNWALGLADRKAMHEDAVFPMGYSDAIPTEDERKSAFAFWKEVFDLSVGGGKLVCCYFGALGYQSDFSTVLDAAGRLRERAPEIRFVICGKGDREQELRQHGADCSNIIFPGWVDFPKIWTLMQIAGVGLVPFWNSPNYVSHIPNKPVEYMSGGLVLVSSLSGTLSKLLCEQRCGLTYPEGDSEKLAEYIFDLSENPQKTAAMGASARALFEDRFVADVVYSQMTDHLTAIVVEGELSE